MGIAVMSKSMLGVLSRSTTNPERVMAASVMIHATNAMSVPTVRLPLILTRAKAGMSAMRMFTARSMALEATRMTFPGITRSRSQERCGVAAMNLDQSQSQIGAYMTPMRVE